jgi:hypothetical protein
MQVNAITLTNAVEAGGVELRTRVKNKQLIQNATRSKRTTLRIWRIGVLAVYTGITADQTLTTQLSRREFVQRDIVTRFPWHISRIGELPQFPIYFAAALLTSL